jgi:uncharacterized protein (DUF58 family)
MIPSDVIRQIRRIQIRTKHLVNDVFAGQYHSAFKGRGMEFHEVREYVPGDDIRSIDWNVTARTGWPHVKKFIEEREMTVMLLVDVSASHRFGSSPRLKKDLAAELAAVLAFSAVSNNDRVGLLLFTDDVELTVPPDKGLRHVLRIIREVLYFEPARAGTRIEPALERLNHVLRRRAVTFLISDFETEEDLRRPLAVTARRHDLTALRIGDKRESAWPRAGLVEWRDLESGERRVLDTSDRAVRVALQAFQARRRDAMRETLRSSGVDLVDLAVEEPYERRLAEFFRMRERRRRL